MAVHASRRSCFTIRVRVLRRDYTIDVDHIRGVGMVVPVCEKRDSKPEASADIYRLNRLSQKRHKKSHEEGISKFEQELKMRLRSATGTW
jgi:hypothetical protein